MILLVNVPCDWFQPGAKPMKRLLVETPSILRANIVSKILLTAFYLYFKGISANISQKQGFIGFFICKISQ